MNTLKSYYRIHAPVYDLSRWTFLFGRQNLLQHLPDLTVNSRILDVGCGTGYHLKQLSENNPNYELTGIDLSEDMLRICRKKLNESDQLNLINSNFLDVDLRNNSYDLIIASYSLSMMADPFKALDRMFELLKPGGCLAILDFSESRHRWFREWMEWNHVRFEKQLLDNAGNKLEVIQQQEDEVYLGLWKFELLVARKAD